MATPQPAIFTAMGKNQWYVHLSRTEGADLGAIKAVLRDLRADCAAQGINLTLGFGPAFLPEVTKDLPPDFQPFVTIEAAMVRAARPKAPRRSCSCGSI